MGTGLGAVGVPYTWVANRPLEHSVEVHAVPAWAPLLRRAPPSGLRNGAEDGGVCGEEGVTSRRRRGRNGPAPKRNRGYTASSGIRRRPFVSCRRAPPGTTLQRAPFGSLDPERERGHARDRKGALLRPLGPPSRVLVLVSRSSRKGRPQRDVSCSMRPVRETQSINPFPLWWPAPGRTCQ